MDTIKRLANGSCPLVATDVFTATAKTSVLAIDVSNSSGSTQGLTVKLAGKVLINVLLPGPGGCSWHGPQVLEAGDTINLVSTSALCEYNISGVEIT